MLTRTPRISKEKYELILKCFAQDKTALMTAEDTNLHRHTIDLYFRHIREVIYRAYSKAPRFTGEVEVDQAFFGRGTKKKTSSKRFLKHNYGDPLYFEGGRKRRKKKMGKPRIKNTQVFGILRRGGDVYTHIIKKADRNTLFPIIHLVVAPKTTIYSDAWPAYNDLKIDGYKHGVVNHTTGYRSKKGVHTGGIDSFWSIAKERLRKFRGISSSTFPLYLKECEFRWNTRDRNVKSFHHKERYLGVLKILKVLIKGTHPEIKEEL